MAPARMHATPAILSFATEKARIWDKICSDSRFRLRTSTECSLHFRHRLRYVNAMPSANLYSIYLPGAAAPFLSKAGQLTITFSDCGAISGLVSTRKRWPSRPG